MTTTEHDYAAQARQAIEIVCSGDLSRTEEFSWVMRRDYGGHAKRTVETLDELTSQEAQVARLAADGHTNPQIGAQIFLSPRTVEWHLSKVFGKLGIGSRKELRSALSDIDANGVSI